MPQTLFYRPGKAPNAQEREPKEIVLFLERELNAVSQSFTESSHVKFRELHAEPERPRDGMVVYADGTNWNPGDGEGIYAYVAGSWVATGVAATIAAAQPAFSVHKNNVDQTGIVDATATLITWATEVYDIGGYFASNAWTPPAGLVTMTAAFGYMYPVGGSLNFPAIGIRKNGALYRRVHAENVATSGSGVTITIEDRANGTDAYSVETYMDVSAGTGVIYGQSTHTYFMGHWIGP